MISNLILNSKKSTLLISFTALGLLSCPFQVYGMDMPHSIEDVLYAAYQGDRDAQHQLGDMYYNGNGVEQNKKLAFHYHKLAADQEHAIACALLANSYFFGRDTESDCLRALDYSYKAYKAGYPSAQFLEYVNFNKNEPLQEIEIDRELLIKKIEDTYVKLSAFKAFHAPHNTVEKPIKFISIPNCYEPYCQITDFQADLLNCYQQIIENVERNPGLFISCLQPNRFFKHYQSNQKLFQRVFSAVKIKDIVYCSIGGNNPSIGHNFKQLLEDKDKVLNAYERLAFGLECGKQTLLSRSTTKDDDLSIKHFDEQKKILTHSHTVIKDGIEELQNLIKITAPHRNAAFAERFNDREK